MKPETSLLHPEKGLKDPHGANSFPIYQTATFAQTSADANGTYDYSRSGNPTRDQLQAILAELDQAKYAFAFTTGMAAISAICRLLKPGDEVLSNADIYGGTHRYFTQILSQLGIHIRFIKATHLSDIEHDISSHTKLVWIETPSNPFQKITDIQAVAKLKEKYSFTLCVDNTMISSWAQKPLNLGADIVIQSATKYLSGHGDVSAGVVTTNSKTLEEHLSFIQNAEGTALAPHESWLLIRGLQTLGLRYDKQQQNAEKIAKHLLNHDFIKCVHYAGLASHQNHKTHIQQAAGSGCVISFETGDKAFSKLIAEATKIFSISVSFGSIKSSISLPFYMSHASITESLREVPNDLIRLSAGIEHIDDLITDLEQAFQYAQTKHTINKKQISHSDKINAGTI